LNVKFSGISNRHIIIQKQIVQKKKQYLIGITALHI